ncbi:MAG: hypothetical protein FWF72_05935, partial [Paludibacter sp.]|nr:hypothetical protein [Paludibacter sp.]
IIEQLNCVALLLPCDCPYDYWETDKIKGKGILSMRHAAVLAGLGSLGKNTLFMNKLYGNFLTLGAILTNLDLKSDHLSEELCIENCHLCLDNCPVNALDGKTVNQKLCRPYTYTTNERGFEVVNCNKCRIVCPKRFGM